MTADFVTVAIGWFCFNVFRFFTLPIVYSFGSLSAFLLSTPVVLGQLAVPPAMVILYAISGSYNRTEVFYRSRLDELINTIIVSFIGMLGIYFIALVNDNINERVTNYELMTMLLLCLIVPTELIRYRLTAACARRIRSGEYALKTLIIGIEPKQEGKLKKIIESRFNTGLTPVACVDIDGENDTDSIFDLPIYHKADIKNICNDLNIQAIVLLGTGNLTRSGKIINELYPLELPLYITPDLHNLMTARPKFSAVNTEPLVDISNAHISPASVNLKRIGDIISSAIALIILLPFMAIIAIIVKFDSDGPVFYRQERIGYHKKPFNIIKFRSMRTNAECNGPALASDDDPRITRFGRFMRKYRIDELPQFWNVLKGDMSLVGPRPEREFYIRRILEHVPSASLLHQVRPGITSWGAVRYGYASNIDEMIERVYFDLLYIENISFGVDLKILFHTVNTVIRGRGK